MLGLIEGAFEIWPLRDKVHSAWVGETGEVLRVLQTLPQTLCLFAWTFYASCGHERYHFLHTGCIRWNDCDSMFVLAVQRAVCEPRQLMCCSGYPLYSVWYDHVKRSAHPWKPSGPVLIIIWRQQWGQVRTQVPQITIPFSQCLIDLVCWCGLRRHFCRLASRHSAAEAYEHILRENVWHCRKHTSLMNERLPCLLSKIFIQRLKVFFREHIKQVSECVYMC